jgi:hypothetical protein
LSFGFWVWGLGCGDCGLEVWVWGFRFVGLSCWVCNLGFGVWGLGFGILGLGFETQSAVFSQVVLEWNLCSFSSYVGTRGDI